MTYIDPTGIVAHPDEFHDGQSWKRPVMAAATGNVTIASPGSTFDGVTFSDPTIDDRFRRILLPAQTDGTENGIYDWHGAAAPMTRAFDMDQDFTSAAAVEEIAGAFVYVVGGTTNGGKQFHTTNDLGDQLGIDDVVWEEWGASAGSSDAFVPTYLGPTETFTVPANRQALFAVPIDNEGILDVEGLLIEVD